MSDWLADRRIELNSKKDRNSSLEIIFGLNGLPKKVNRENLSSSTHLINHLPIISSLIKKSFWGRGLFSEMFLIANSKKLLQSFLTLSIIWEIF